jgi:hypothetical protein
MKQAILMVRGTFGLKKSPWRPIHYSLTRSMSKQKSQLSLRVLTWGITWETPPIFQGPHATHGGSDIRT